MDKTTWDEQLATGIESIDIQHKALIKECAKVMDEVEQGIDEPVIKKHLAFFLSYAMNHFTDEEEFMRSNGYPDIEKHMKEHHAIKERIQYFMDHQLESNAHEFTYFLSHLWVRHIHDVDFLYVKFIREQGK